MTDTPAVVADLREKFSKADSKVKRRETALASALEARDELAIAMRVLAKHGYMDSESVAPANMNRQTGLNEKQALVFSCVPHGEDRAVAPKFVTDVLNFDDHTDITGDYVRTTLWRLAQRGMLRNANGLYWRAESAEAENVATPGVFAPGADNGIAGPLGGERGYPPSAPEGSIPSGSTLSPEALRLLDDTPGDDDVPF